MKDIQNRFQVSQGKRVHFRLGIDCLHPDVERQSMSRLLAHSGVLRNYSQEEIRAQCQAYVELRVQSHLDDMAKWGLMSDPKGSYVTLTKDYIHGALLLFQKMQEKRLVVSTVNTVFWSPSQRN